MWNARFYGPGVGVGVSPVRGLKKGKRGWWWEGKPPGGGGRHVEMGRFVGQDWKYEDTRKEE